ncbi:TonB-dependent receptor family protein [Formosa algae]|uniref:Iron complex outermembrane receptor protein n=1 Tax=Formosa algae TaxID=225843 RepID=A0A9X0YP89_9FLAO|nr:TonB-dependent receptor [Formosa algae]MBP1840503.1 iron complex outermembrane receptor protein [Formosa algae]MDQ0336084.1 iron complex outermembrane receptor protein [Formosa algae]OEI81033.1 TonB-dependent receptor [Formosa algae]
MRIPPLKYVLVMALLCGLQSLRAQQLQGKIQNSEGAGISCVELYVKTTLITTTDATGAFQLSDAWDVPLRLTLKHPDYYVKTVNLTSDDEVLTLLPLDHDPELDPVVISSTYQKASQLIIPTTKVTSETFDAYSPIDIVSALNQTPGVYIQSGALNTNRITIRGVGSRTLYGTNKIRAYYDGIPITNGAGETSIDAFDPESMANVEVVKGPKATQYGTNLGGTLLLNTKHALAGETYIQNNFSVGSFGLLKNRVALGTAEDRYAIQLQYDHLETDGFRDNSRYRRNALLLTSRYQLNTNNEFGVLLNYTNYFAQIPSSIGKTAFETDPSQAAYTWSQAQGYEDNDQVLVGLNYTHRFSERFSNTMAVFYSYLDHYEPRPFNILDEYTNGYGIRTLFAQDFDFFDRQSTLSFGTELYQDAYTWRTIENLYESNDGNGSLEGELLSDNLEKRYTAQLFATTTLQLTGALKLQMGFNLNSTRYQFTDYFNVGDSNTSADRNFDPIFAPNLNLLYQLTSDIKLYANVSRGFNYPSIEETLTPSGLINPDLGPETGYNYELGSAFYTFQGRMHVQLSAYLLDIDNLLVADRVGDDQYIGRNAGQTEHKGVEVAVSFSQLFANGWSLRPYVNAEFSDNRFVNFVDGETDYSGNVLTGVPSTKINGGLQLAYKYFSLNTNVLHIGDMPLDDANTLYSDPYTVLNTKLTYRSDLSPRLSFELHAGINNFTDETYASSVLINAVGFGDSEPRYYYPGDPRNWYGGLKLNYAL